MKSIGKTVVLVWISTHAVSAMIPVMAQESESRKAIIISEKVGETIDLKERNQYRLFLFMENFKSAVVVQMSDSSFVMRITEEENGIKRVDSIPITLKVLQRLRQYIDNSEKLDDPDKDIFSVSPKKPNEELKRVPTIEVKRQEAKQRIAAAKRQARISAKEKWTKERWKEEILNDRGQSYRTSGMLVGFLAGSAAGMLIGKGFQGKKVKSQIVHEVPGWDENDPKSYYTEKFYSYKYKHAPHWGAAIGGIGGAVAGYFMGKKADKEYYILVPKDIRQAGTSSSWFTNLVMGFGVTGIGIGGISGMTLCTPASDIGENELKMGVKEFEGGYGVGAILGTAAVAGYNGRAKRVHLWEESILEQKPESFLDIRFIPLDPASFCVLPRKSPSGETFYEYRMDMVRIRF